ncbi:hypothetical protein ACFE04_027081 [Oxalis oulophora]
MGNWASRQRDRDRCRGNPRLTSHYKRRRDWGIPRKTKSRSVKPRSRRLAIGLSGSSQIASMTGCRGYAKIKDDIGQLRLRDRGRGHWAEPMSRGESRVQSNEGTPFSTQPNNVFESITKCVVGSSKSDVKAKRKRKRNAKMQSAHRAISDVVTDVDQLAHHSLWKNRILHIKRPLRNYQLYCEKETLNDQFHHLKAHVDIGDILGATGELSVRANFFAIKLTKSLLPLLDKYHGQTDVDKRYRQRRSDIEKIIAMGFPAGDISFGIFRYIERFYRHHMEEVIKFFETHHKIVKDVKFTLNQPFEPIEKGITKYWNSWLAIERQRLLSSFNHNDVIFDVFSGVGPTAISAAKIMKRVLSPMRTSGTGHILPNNYTIIWVLRMWEPLFGKQQFPSELELAVMDNEGTRMWCTVPQLMIKSVKMKVKENGVYVLQNFFVGLSTVKPNQTRVSTQKYKINFQQNTSIITTDDHDFPPTRFDIRSCADVLNRNGVNEVDLIDVLGLLVTKHDIVPFSIEGKPHRRLTIVLQDLDLSVDDGDASSQLITTVSSTQSETLVDDLMSSHVRSIEELLTLEEGAIVWICGTVMGIVPSEKWCYLGCKKCSKSVKKDGNRYLVETNVVDSTAPISVTIWDREGFQIYGKTTNEMRETKDGNVSLFPAELKLICGRKFLFKIHKKSANNNSGELCYHVMKITEDKNLLTKFVISPSGGLSDEKPYVTTDKTPCSKSQESVGDTISKDCTPAKRLFPTPAIDDDSHNASATKVPKITIKVEK